MYSQKNAEQFYESIGTIAGFSFERHRNYDVVRSRNTSWPNALLNVRGTRSELGSFLDQIEAQKPSEIILPKFIKCCPTADNADLLNLAKERNYRTGAWAAMTHSLDKLPPQKTQLLSIQQVTSQNEIQLWGKIVAKELMNDPEMDVLLFESMIAMETCYFYLGWIGNKAIASSMLFVKEGVGGIYLVATEREYRKQGFGAEVTNICLHKAKELNCQRVDIQATDAGRNMYASLGFKDAGRIHVVGVP
ncbi:MAG: hypothetical protein Crog4KO_24790 [Crocinitomicaceae bacterium]